MSIRRKYTPIIAALALTLTLAACSGAERNAPEVASDSHVESESEPEFAFDARIDDVPLRKGGAWTSAESFIASPTAVLVNKRTVEASWALPDGKFDWFLYSDLNEEPVLLAEEVEGEESVLSSSIGLQQDPKAESLVVMANHVREKAEGLKTSSSRVEVNIYDFNGTKLNSWKLSRNISEDRDAGGARDHIVSAVIIGKIAVIAVKIYNDGEGVSWISGIDTSTGNEVWERKCAPDSGLTMLSDETTIALDCGDDVLGINTISGATEWTATYVNLDSDGCWEDCSPIVNPVKANAKFSTILVTENGLDHYGLYEVSPGTHQLVDISEVDSVAGLGVIRFADGFRDTWGELDPDLWPDSAITFVVKDLSTGEDVFSLTAKDERESAVRLLGAFDGRLWIWNEDGLDVVNARTGERDSLAPTKADGYQHSKNVPAHHGLTWVYLSNTNGNGDLTPARLYRDPAGDISAESLPASEVTGLSF